MRTAENLRRIRQERGLSYAELARRLARTGHPILDTGLLKIEKGERRVDVDDLVALAIALDTTPNRLLLPGADGEWASDAGRLAPDIPSTPSLMWAWATGEVPLGRHAARATDDRRTRGEEVAFNRENRPQHWGLMHFARSEGEARLGAGHVLVVAGLNKFVAEAVRHLFSTDEIRGIVEGAIWNALLSPAPAVEESTLELSEDGKVAFRLNFRPVPQEDA